MSVAATASVREGRLRSPGMVAAVAAASPPLRTGAPRDFVKSKRDFFERGLSEASLKVPRVPAPLERGLSVDSFRWRRENEAQRLVKYRSASSLASVDSGLSLSRSNSVGSSEDLRHTPLSRSCSNERLCRRRRSSGCSSSSRFSSLTRSSTTLSLHRLTHDDAPARRPRSQASSPPSSPDPPDPVLPDLLPPPLPPKRRPPLPPRRSSSEAPPLPPKFLRQPVWDGDSDGGSEGTSDVSLPEYLVDGDDSLEPDATGAPRGAVRGTIPESFPFRDPLHKFLADLGHALSTEVVIKNVYGARPGHLDLHAHTTPTPTPTPTDIAYSMPQSTAPARPPSLPREASLGSGPDQPVSKKYRTELQIFFRTGAVSRLEEQRDLVLTDVVTHFQAHCRGFLARKRLEKRKVQETAIRCIQKNVRKFMAVRDWPWWRLLVRVTPLLNVHRTEEDLRATKDELEAVRARLEKAEKERTTLKHENEKMEARLAEVTADLSEEHNTAHLAGERLEAEQAERMKLEKEVERLQNNMRMMSTANGKLEMEKQALQSEVLNGEAEHDEEEAADASLYRRKYEWCLREIELLKKQLKQQQEDDLDHLLLLKKQLEKKVADAYEETEEQRQVVAQVKRKSQRIQAEMNDLKILLEEQTSRNNMLEKKQRKFDQDMMAAQEELRHERANKDKVQREKDQILSEKYSFEQEVATLKLELELKEEKLTALNRQLEDLNFTGKSEEEVAVLKKAKHDLELRVKDQEEELDDLAGQVQMLEGAKVRLEMSIEQMRKENRREVSQREEELEEVRLSAQKKVKALESQLENEHEERTLLVREKHELERRVSDLQDRHVSQVDEEYVHKLKKELKKTKALLRDTQTMLEKSQSEGGQKLLVRQLKTQLEDAEFAKTAAIKARQCAEADLSDLTSQMEEAQRSRKEAEDRCARIGKERAEIQTQLEESEEEVAEVMKKYKSVVSQLSVDQITLSEQTQQIAELEHEKQVLHERLLELSSKVEVLEGETANIHTQRRLELKIKEVESKLELEQTTRQRLESQISRLKDQLERVTGDCDSARLKEAQAVEQNKRVARQLRDAKEDLSTLQQRHTDAVNKKSEMEKQLELADSEVATLKSDLKLAFKRIEDLQQAIQGDLNDSDSDLSDSDSDSDGSLSSYLTASLKQQMSSSNSTLRTPPSEVHQLDRAEQPTSPCSEAISEDLDEAAATRESFA